MRQLSFEHAPTLDIAAQNFVDGGSTQIVIGPPESGKSVLGIAIMYMIGCCIPRCHDGYRRSRMLICRNTEGELDRGIKKSWLDWFPEDQYGPFKGTMPSTQRIKIRDMIMDVELFAFEDESQRVMKKLRSTEYTAAFINEGQYFTQKMVKAIEQRTGRYPKKDVCPDFDRNRRMFVDMNMPGSDDHWMLRMTGRSPLPTEMSVEDRLQYKKPDGWEFFFQPPSVFAEKNVKGQITGFKVNPNAENLFYSTEQGILALTQGANVNDVRRDYMMEVVPEKSGIPRYNNFSMEYHVQSDKPIEVVDGVPIICGHDPGLNGGWVFLQHVNSQWRCFMEYKADNLTADEQAPIVKEMLSRRAPNWLRDGFIGWGDPFGSRASAAAGGGAEAARTVFDILRGHGLEFKLPAMKDNPETRLNTGRRVLQSNASPGVPKALFCSRGCPQLIAALNGGMTMKRVGGGKYGEVKMAVDKKYPLADVGEAWEYAMWGGGESRDVVLGASGVKQNEPIFVKPKRNLYRRRR